jgi:hypothetical protein
MTTCSVGSDKVFERIFACLDVIPMLTLLQGCTPKLVSSLDSHPAKSPACNARARLHV